MGDFQGLSKALAGSCEKAPCLNMYSSREPAVMKQMHTRHLVHIFAYIIYYYNQHSGCTALLVISEACILIMT